MIDQPAQRTLSVALALVAGLATAPRAHAYEPPLDEPSQWVRFSTEDGLPSDGISTVLEGQDGTVWAATEGGLAWYDGWRWTALDADDGVPREPVLDLAEDADSTIWVAQESGVRTGGRAGFRKVGLPESGLRVVNVVAHPDSGVLLLARRIRAGGPVLLHLADGAVKEVDLPTRKLASRGKALSRLASGRIWLRANNSAHVWDGGRWVTWSPLDSGLPALSAIFESPEGDGVAGILYPDEHAGVWEWRAGAPPVRAISDVHGLFAAAAISPSGRAVVTFHGGTSAVRQNGEWRRIPRPAAPLRDARCLYYGATGHLWAATHQGLWLLRGTRPRWTVVHSPSPDPRSRHVNDFAFSDDGSLWIATGAGIERHGPDGAAVPLPPLPDAGNRYATGIAVDAEGDVWAVSGGAFEGARRWDGERWHVVRTDVDGRPLGLINKVRLDGEGRLWLLSLARSRAAHKEHKGAVHLVRADGRVERWEPSDVLAGRRIYDVAEGPDGALWFATSSGVARWQDGSWAEWAAAEGVNGVVQSIASDRRGGAWAGHQAGGLAHIEPDGRVHYETRLPGAFTPHVWGLDIDADGRLWMTTDRGLLGLIEGSWWLFDSATGLQATHLWPVLATDRVYVGSRGGGLWTLDLLEARTPPPRAYITLAKVEEGEAVVRWTAQSLWGEVASESIETRHRVDGGSWSDWSSNRELRLGNLDYGEHRVEVQAKAVFGKLSAIRSVQLNVRPPIYLHPAFVFPLSSMCLLLLCGFALHGWRRRRYLETVETGRARLRAQFESVPIRTYVWRANGDDLVFEDFNRTAAGASRVESILGARASEMYAERPDILADMKRCAAERTTFEREFDFRRIVDGHNERLVVTYAFVAPDLVLVYARDVTALHKAVDALKESEARLRNAQRIARLGFWDLDVAENTLYWSDEIYRMFGVSREDFAATYEAFLWSVHPDDRRIVGEAVRSALDGRTDYAIDHRIVLPNGDVRWVHEQGEVERDVAGEPIRMVGTVVDISDRKRIERVTSHVIQNMPIMIAAVDASANLVMWNRECERVTGYTRDEIVGNESAFDLLHPPRSHRDRLRAEQRLQRDCYHGLPRVLKAKDGSQRTVLWTDISDRFLFPEWPTLGIGIDVTERTRVEEERDGLLVREQQARATAEEASTRLQALSARLVEVQETERRALAFELHDQIGQMLTGLRLLIGRVSKGAAAEVAEPLRDAQSVLDKLLDSVRSMSLTLRPAMLDDLGLIPTLHWKLDEFKRHSGTEVSFHHRLIRRRFSTAVETAVFRIVQESLTNVARHAGANSVDVHLWQSMDSLFVHVQDNGRGFDQESVRASGRSLGLQGMRERISHLGGELVIDSLPGGGTWVTAEIPLGDEPAGGHEQGREQQREQVT